MHTSVRAGSGNTPSATSQVLIIAIVCSFAVFILGMLLGALLHYWATVRCVHISSSHRSTPQVATVPVIYEEVSHSERKSDIELKNNIAYGPVVTAEIVNIEG